MVLAVLIAIGLLHRVLAVLSAIGLKSFKKSISNKNIPITCSKDGQKMTKKK